MTRTYAAKRLLEHGELTFAEFLNITGWTISQADKTIQALVQQGIACTLHRVGCRRKIYALAQELAGVRVVRP